MYLCCGSLVFDEVYGGAGVNIVTIYLSSFFMVAPFFLNKFLTTPQGEFEGCRSPMVLITLLIYPFSHPMPLTVSLLEWPHFFWVTQSMYL